MVNKLISRSISDILYIICLYDVALSYFPGNHKWFLIIHSATIQDNKDILPVATLSIALHVLRRSRPASDVAPEVAILLSAL